MANLNRIILVGRLASEPEGRATLDGLPMTKFKLAVSQQPAASSEASFQAGTDFFDIIAWRRAAEISSGYLKKGQLVLVEGRIQIRSFEDQTGQRRWVTEVVARDVRALDKNSVSPAPVSEEAVDDIDLASDLPF